MLVLVTAASVGGRRRSNVAERWKFADVVDMEAAAVAAVARETGLHFAAIKAISDELEFVMPPFKRFCGRTG